MLGVVLDIVYTSCAKVKETKTEGKKLFVFHSGKLLQSCPKFNFGVSLGKSISCLPKLVVYSDLFKTAFLVMSQMYASGAVRSGECEG